MLYQELPPFAPSSSLGFMHLFTVSEATGRAVYPLTEAFEE
jgi:hypothetical protein